MSPHKTLAQNSESFLVKTLAVAQVPEAEKKGSKATLAVTQIGRTSLHDITRASQSCRETHSRGVLIDAMPMVTLLTRAVPVLGAEHAVPGGV